MASRRNEVRWTMPRSLNYKSLNYRAYEKFSLRIVGEDYITVFMFWLFQMEPSLL